MVCLMLSDAYENGVFGVGLEKLFYISFFQITGVVKSWVVVNKMN